MKPIDTDRQHHLRPAASCNITVWLDIMPNGIFIWRHMAERHMAHMAPCAEAYGGYVWSMHSHDRTLLARLGFSDPDRKDPFHDKACRYLSTSPRAELLFSEPPSDIEADWHDSRKLIHYTRRVLDTCVLSKCELSVNKGLGAYKTTVGFIDVALHRYAKRSCGPWCAPTCDFHSTSFSPDFNHVSQGGSHDTYDSSIGIEVKIQPASWSDLLRQINLYRDYIHFNKWVAALAFPVTEAYVEALKKEDVSIVRLGDKFKVWCSEQSAVTNAIVTEI